jgi:hypothetical protein
MDNRNIFEYYNESNSLNSFHFFPSKPTSFSDEKDFLLDYQDFSLTKESSEENVFMKRTHLDSQCLRNNTDNYLYLKSIADLSEKMRIKKERTKFLLNKTRRDEDQTEPSSLAALLKKNEDNRKEIRMQKNRESAQKSRANKKIENEILKTDQQRLLKENSLLKTKLFNLIVTTNKVCEECRKIFCKEEEKNTKKKFVVVQGSKDRNNGNSMSINKLLGFTGLFVILCLIMNLFFSQENLNSQESKSKNMGRLLKEEIKSYYKTDLRPVSNNSFFPNKTLTLAKDNNNFSSYTFFKNLKEIKSKNNLTNTQNIQKDFQTELNKSKENVSFYIRFIDYLKMQTGFTPYLKEETFLSKDNSSLISKEACINNKTFILKSEVCNITSNSSQST